MIISSPSYRTTVLLLAVVFLPPGALAAQQARPAACSDASHRQFDYWLGNWEVTDSAGSTVYGTNRITSEEGNCLLHERWVGAKGGSGQSLNFYDAAAGHWTQVWVGSDGLVLSISGRVANGAMTLEGEGRDPVGKPVRHRASWTPQSDGRVRQYWQQSTDGGTTWTVAFDGWYRKR